MLIGAYNPMLRPIWDYRYPDVVDGAIAASAPIWQLAGGSQRCDFDAPALLPGFCTLSGFCTLTRHFHPIATRPPYTRAHAFASQAPCGGRASTSRRLR